MKKCKPAGMTFTFNGQKGICYAQYLTVTQNNKVLKDLQKTILSLENGIKINGYVKFEEGLCIPSPAAFTKTVMVLNYLGVSTELLDEAPDKKTKGKYIIVTLTQEQEAELQKLKTLCV